MARYIDAEEFRKKVLKWMPTDPCEREEKEFPFEQDICVSMLMEIEEAPTEDVAPVVHAKWISHTEDDSLVPPCEWLCSNCKSFVDLYEPSYCPHCGAKMDKE